MPLKPYSELVKLDVSPYCDQRETQDDNNKKIRVPYLNWAKCKELLHENGAEVVYYTPVRGPDGSYLFPSCNVVSKNGRKTGCWFVSVEIHIDDMAFTMDTPLLNGSIMVYEDTLNQLRNAVRFGQITPTPRRVAFFFERLREYTKSAPSAAQDTTAL